MHRLIASLALTFLLVPSGIAQEQQKTRCRVRFAVVQKQGDATFKVQPDDRDSWGQWPEDAREWWVKDGNRKFAELCEATRTDAEFVVAWEKEAITKRVRARGKGYIWYRDVRLDLLSTTLYRVEKETQQFGPLSSLAKESFPDRGAGKAAFESALEALRKEDRKSRR